VRKGRKKGGSNNAGLDAQPGSGHAAADGGGGTAAGGAAFLCGESVIAHEWRCVLPLSQSVVFRVACRFLLRSRNRRIRSLPDRVNVEMHGKDKGTWIVMQKRDLLIETPYKHKHRILNRSMADALVAVGAWLALNAERRPFRSSGWRRDNASRGEAA